MYRRPKLPSNLSLTASYAMDADHNFTLGALALQTSSSLSLWDVVNYCIVALFSHIDMVAYCTVEVIDPTSEKIEI